MNNINKTILIVLFMAVIFVTLPVSVLHAQQYTADKANTTQYFSPEELKRADKVIAFLSSPELVYSVLISFSLLVVFATYLAIVGLLVVFFIGKYL